ncbi:hypothetical protein [Neptunomonas sp.]|uniref:hypothetical protein n=1 Tax=Neptunomonas sp. TaxID=1971898 RepID=UPI0025E62598|nr:hypothetical protein [Neptunomonas sp.]
MHYIYIAAAVVFSAFFIVLMGLWKGKVSNIKNTLTCSLLSILFVTLCNILWSGFIGSFYWGHSQAPSKNYMNIAAKLVCGSDVPCRLEKDIDSYKLTVRESEKLSQNDLAEIKERSIYAGDLLFLINPPTGRRIYIERE